MKKFILAFALFAATSVFAGKCDNLYPGNKEFAIPGTVELCNSFYVIRFDTKNGRNVASIDLIKAGHGKVVRLNNFHADTRLPTAVSASPTDYLKTGYDKGHMTPAGDSADDAQMSETFLMSNMTPQVPELNRGPWRLMEEGIRTKVDTDKQDTYVITGAVYSSNPSFIGTKVKVPVPSGYYKIVYFKTGMVAYYADNTDTAKIQTKQVSDIEKLTGLVFPK